MSWVRWGRRGIPLAILAVAVLAVRPLEALPARLVAGCPTWIGVAGAFELLSAVGFVVVFKLVFGSGLDWRQNVLAGLRALGAVAVLPGGGLVGPVVGARSADGRSGDIDRARLPDLARASIAFTVLTNVPEAVALGTVGLLLWLGVTRGPHGALLTLPAAGFGLAAVGGGWLLRRHAAAQPRRLGLVRGGLVHAGQLLARRNWKLTGALGYYAFDNAVLWAAFHAYGHAPAPSVVVMGYLVGSLGSALPIPGGFGAIEGGLIGGLVLYGAPAAAAVTAVLLYRGVSLALPALLGTLAWAGRAYSPTRRWRRSREDSEDDRDPMSIPRACRRVSTSSTTSRCCRPARRRAGRAGRLDASRSTGPSRHPRAGRGRSCSPSRRRRSPSTSTASPSGSKLDTGVDRRIAWTRCSAGSRRRPRM